MGSSVDSARQSADDGEPAESQIPRQPLGHLIPVGRRASRANNSNRMPVQKIRISFDIQKRRRVVNLSKQLRVDWLIPGDNAAFRCFGLGKLLRGRADRLARVNGLS